MDGLRRPHYLFRKIRDNSSFYILWTFGSIFSTCPYGIAVKCFSLKAKQSKAKQSKAKFDMLCCTSTRPRCFKFSQIYLPRCLCEDSPCRACSKSCDASAYTEWSSGLSGTRVRISAECACFYRNQGLDAFLVATLYFFCESTHQNCPNHNSV